MRSKEHLLQVSIIDYINKILPTLRSYVFAVPNGGLRNVIVATKLKKEGVTAGVPDLFIDVPINLKHGLRIELKYGTNKLTPHQKSFKERMEKIGYVIKECRSIEVFEDILLEYFGLENLTNKEINSIINGEEFIQRNKKYANI